MQIVNPLRAALPYITLQTAKVQHCWADYFIFRGFAGAAGRFGSAETHELRSCRPPSGRAGLRPMPAFCWVFSFFISSGSYYSIFCASFQCKSHRITAQPPRP